MSDKATTTSSGLVTVTTKVIFNRPCKVHNLMSIPAAAASSAIVYDNASAASGTAVAQAQSVANGATVSVTLNDPVECSNGATVIVTGTGGQAIVHFSPL